MSKDSLDGDGPIADSSSPKGTTAHSRPPVKAVTEWISKVLRSRRAPVEYLGHFIGIGTGLKALSDHNNEPWSSTYQMTAVLGMLFWSWMLFLSVYHFIYIKPVTVSSSDARGTSMRFFRLRTIATLFGFRRFDEPRKHLRLFLSSIIVALSLIVLFWEPTSALRERILTGRDTLSVLVDDEAAQMERQAPFLRDALESSGFNLDYREVKERPLGLSGRTALETYRANRWTAAAIWVHIPSNPGSATNETNVTIERSPAWDWTGYESPLACPSSLSLQQCIRLGVLEQALLMKCVVGDDTAVFELARKYLPVSEDSLPIFLDIVKDHQSDLACIAKAAYTLREHLPLEMPLPVWVEATDAVLVGNRAPISSAEIIAGMSYVKYTEAVDIYESHRFGDAELLLGETGIELEKLTNALGTTEAYKQLRADIGWLLGEVYLAESQLRGDDPRDLLSKAISSFDASATVFENPDARYGLGRSYFLRATEVGRGLATADIQSSIQHLTRTLEMSPTLRSASVCDVLIWLSQAYAYQGDDFQKQETLRRANSGEGCIGFPAIDLVSQRLSGNQLTIEARLPPPGIDYVATLIEQSRIQSSSFAEVPQRTAVYTATLDVSSLLVGGPYVYAYPAPGDLRIQKLITDTKLWIRPRISGSGTPDGTGSGGRFFGLELSDAPRLRFEVKSPPLLVSGGTVTMTAWIEGDVGTPNVPPDVLRDPRILSQLDFAVRQTYTSSLPLPMSPLPGIEIGRYVVTYSVDSPGYFTPTIVVRDRSSGLVLSGAFTASIPLRVLNPDILKKEQVLVLKPGEEVLLSDTPLETPLQVIPVDTCTIVTVVFVPPKYPGWYEINYYESELEIRGWVSATTDIAREFNRQQMQDLAVTIAPAGIYSQYEADAAKFTIPECTLVKIDKSREGEGRYYAEIFFGSGTHGWLDEKRVRRWVPPVSWQTNP